jgi:hypothetical protein
VEDTVSQCLTPDHVSLGGVISLSQSRSLATLENPDGDHLKGGLDLVSMELDDIGGSSPGDKLKRLCSPPVD